MAILKTHYGRPSYTVKNEKVEVKTGGMVFLGPIPLIFGSDTKAVVLVSVLAIVMMIIFWLITKPL